MNKTYAAIILLAVLLLLGGCGAPKQGAAPVASEKSYENGAVAGAGSESFSTVANDADGQAPVERKVTRKASLVMAVSNVTESYNQIQVIVNESGGYLQNADIHSADGQMRSTLTLRVPAAKLEEILSALEPLGKVEGKNISGQDVTEEYYDATARKANLERQEKRLLELYNKAGTVKDILEIENELTRVRGEIESLQARLNVLDNLISLATITVELRAPGGISTGSTLKEPLGTRLKAAWQMGVNGLVNFSEGLLLLGVVLLPYTPFLAAAYLLFYYIVRKRRLKSKDSPTDRGAV
ncbi:hypothetical protein Psch_02740 [Pelotomaculum schinkii]|uniref:DUF4349 domain-containing protein n=2 Tax=Pelotomaculum schinkii TaxID=78350 RepID=A0A4Y7RAF3_9FIRM|nr:hypothetical protein Psch_02740 [Pelotomaculum schinkii]